MKNSIFLACILAFFIACTNNVTQTVYSEWQYKEVLFPTNCDYYIKNNKIKCNANVREKYNILAYIDSIGCLSCNMMLPSWRLFIDSVRLVSNNMVGLEMYVFPRNSKDFVYELVTKDLSYPEIG